MNLVHEFKRKKWFIMVIIDHIYHVTEQFDQSPKCSTSNVQGFQKAKNLKVERESGEVTRQDCFELICCLCVLGRCGHAMAPQERGQNGRGAQQQQQQARITGRRGKLSVSKQIELVRKRREAMQAEERASKRVHGRMSRNAAKDKPSADLSSEEEFRREIERRRKAAVDSLSELFCSADDTSKPLLLIDGYNVVHQHPESKQCLKNNDLSRARESLVQLLDEYAQLRGLRITCIFDGTSSAHTAPSASITSAHSNSTFTPFGTEVVFTTDETADKYIEEETARVFQCNEAPEVYIATSDRQCGDLCGGLGALPLTSKELLRDLEQVRRKAEHDLARQNDQNSKLTRKQGIGTFADTSTFSRLERMRRGFG